MLIKRSASELSDGDDAGSRSPSMPTSPSKAALTTDPDVKPVFDTPTKSGKVKKPKNTPTARSPAKKTGNHKADSPAAAGGKVANGGRLSADAKQVIAREIVRCGLTALDFAALERARHEIKTGLSNSQLRSQTQDNRANVRRQLFDFIKTLV